MIYEHAARDGRALRYEYLLHFASDSFNFFVGTLKVRSSIYFSSRGRDTKFVKIKETEARMGPFRPSLA